MKKIISKINILIVVLALSVPYLITAQVQTGVNSPSVADANNSIVECQTVDDCDWNAFLKTVDKLKNYAFQIVVILSVIFIAIAGFLYLTSAGDSGKINRAKSILQNVVIGFLLAAAGWLIVRTILKTLGVENTDLAPSDLIN